MAQTYHGKKRIILVTRHGEETHAHTLYEQALLPSVKTFEEGHRTDLHVYTGTINYNILAITTALPY